MTQEVEIECKSLLTEEEYVRLDNALPFPNEAVRQTNYYFDTVYFTLRKSHCALRIRKKNDQYILTFKEPYNDKILETKNELTEEQFHAWLNEKPIDENATDVIAALKKYGVNIDTLRLYGSLTTERKIFTKNSVVYCLDKSTYKHKVDYELEVEASTKERAEKAFRHILKQYEIVQKHTPTKIERFYLAEE